MSTAWLQAPPESLTPMMRLHAAPIAVRVAPRISSASLAMIHA